MKSNWQLFYSKNIYYNLRQRKAEDFAFNNDTKGAVCRI